jgi:16S rRNA (guanine527-N7)-methyltransferase
MLDRYVALLLDEATRQNLIAASTASSIWSRHILDSLQLHDLAPAGGLWLDIGSGAGLPGIPIAIVDEARQVELVEPRSRRAAFLDQVVTELAMGSRVHVVATRVERITQVKPAVISARAVAPLGELFAMAEHIAHSSTIWILPKGRNVRAELAAAQEAWHGAFETVPSRTDSEAAIVVARHIRRRKQR